MFQLEQKKKAILMPRSHDLLILETKKRETKEKQSVSRVTAKFGAELSNTLSALTGSNGYTETKLKLQFLA